MSRQDEYDKRDMDLDAPFIDKPDEYETQDGLSCWMDAGRQCGADCVAFNVSALDDHGDPAGGPESCAALDTQINAVSVLRKLLRATQDKERVSTAYPPPVIPGNT